ncbi:MAG: CHASE domain-containing protein, partial [Acidimicrobiales bacterium]
MGPSTREALDDAPASENDSFVQSKPIRLLTGLVLVVGLAASVLAATQWRSYIRDQQNHQVATTTQTAGSSISDALQQDEDLVETMRGVVASGATVNNSQLQELYTNVGATDSAGIIGLAYVESVPFDQLSAYEAQVKADPPLGMPTSGPTVLQREGVRPTYCLIRLAAGSPTGAEDLSRAGVAELLEDLSSNYDYCANQYAAAFGEAAESGQESVMQLDELAKPNQETHVSTRLIDIVVPIYQPGAPTTTISEREQALVGWADGLFSP